MTHTSLKAVRAGLLAALVLLACTAPARAEGEQPAEESRLLLTVNPGETPAVTGGSVLRCDPPSGHRRAADACAELAAVDGRIADLPPKEGVVCPMIYAPITAHATGTWRGHPVTYTQTFPNTCTMTARTGSVFALTP